jgi:hypothetical protein
MAVRFTKARVFVSLRWVNRLLGWRSVTRQDSADKNVYMRDRSLLPVPTSTLPCFRLDLDLRIQGQSLGGRRGLACSRRFRFHPCAIDPKSRRAHMVARVLPDLRCRGSRLSRLDFETVTSRCQDAGAVRTGDPRGGPGHRHRPVSRVETALGSRQRLRSLRGPSR